MNIWSQHGIVQFGDVTEGMDTLIGRPVISIRGSVSANNYVDFQDLNLIGNYVYIQMRLFATSVTTFHIEIATSDATNLRITASTLYEGDKPRFLGRSLRYENNPSMFSLFKYIWYADYLCHYGMAGWFWNLTLT